MSEKTLEERAIEAAENNKKLDSEKIVGVFNILDGIRKQGTRNMFGTGEDLRTIYGFTKTESYEYVEAFMRS